MFDSTSVKSLSASFRHEEITSVDLPNYDFMHALCVVIIMDNKGGVGKSLLAQIIAAMLRCWCDKDDEVAVIDSDTHNSSSYQSDPNARMLDLKRNREAAFIQTLKDAHAGKCRHIVVDIGAREEELMIDLLPWLLSIVQKLSGRVMVARPITTGSHNQYNAREFMPKADKLDIPVILVQNEGQGRCSEDFEDWNKSLRLSECIELGAAKAVMPNFGVRHSDEAMGYGLSITDCALQNFDKIEDEEERQSAMKYFDDDICLMLNERLRMAMRSGGDAFEKAIQNRADIMHKRSQTKISRQAQDEASPHLNLPATGKTRRKV